MQPRCVKCAQAHKAGECTKSDADTLVCANCNGNHVASYRGCPKFKERINARNQPIMSRSVSNQPRKTLSSVPVNEGVSFAQMVRNHSTILQSSLLLMDFLSLITK
jgi:hypothetical protein